MEVYEIENRKYSNQCFNKALKLAYDRKLYEATIFLKKSLLFYKYNYHARNLLALIFYEEGQIGEAIMQWIISRDLTKSDNNIARVYIERVQAEKDFEDQFESVHMYNDALSDVKMQRYDLAMVKLYKSIEKNENNCKAMTLLSILLLMIKDHIKAGTFLRRIQKIDISNPLVNDLMDYTFKNTKKGELREKKLENVYSIRKIEADDAILPRVYVHLNNNQKIVFVVIGMILGIMSYLMIFNSNASRANTNSLTYEVTKFADLVNDQNKIIRDITIENEKLKEDYETTSIRLRAYEEQNRLFTSQYETLNSIISDFDNGYISRAARAYVELDKESITDDTLIILLNNARSRIEGIGAKRLCELGTESWNAGNTQAAISYYQLSLSINPDDPETMYLLARLYQRLNRNSEANPIFDKIISNHPESNYAKRAREARGY